MVWYGTDTVPAVLAMATLGQVAEKGAMCC